MTECNAPAGRVDRKTHHVTAQRREARPVPLAVHAAQARALVATLSEAGMDDESIDLSLASETDVVEALTELVASIRDREAMIAAIKERQDQYGAHKAKLKETIARDKGKMVDFLERIGRNVRTPDGLVYRIEGSRSVRVVNAADIPAEFTRVKTEVEPDLNAIKRALEAGIAVPGVELSNGAPTVGVK